jgi:threonine dehydratase
VKSFGAEVELFGDNYSEAAEYCQKRAKETGRTFIHPFDDKLVITGQGTIGREIIEQLPQTTHIFVPVGGGGLIAGIAQYVKALRPDVKIIGVEPEDSNAMQLSLKANVRIVLPHVGIFADGVAVKQIGEHTFEAAKKYVDDAITVSNDQICAAIKSIFEETRGIVEPAGALATAGIAEYQKTHNLSDAHVVAINSGANMTFERLQFIAERTLLGSSKEAIFAIKLHEKPGALKHFCDTVLNGHGITQFGYRLRARDSAQILLGISVSNDNDRLAFMQKMSVNGYVFEDLSKEDITKEHVRHMIGGPAPKAHNEHFYHISFPERPGALTEFLKQVSTGWNISLFHYRGQGGDIGSVLIGFETNDTGALESAITATFYQWEPVDESFGIISFIR